MVMSAQPVFDALRSVDAQDKRILYMSPRGRKLDRDLVTDLAAEENLVILCGQLETNVHGVTALDKLGDGDRILISEGCTHHRQCGDIGTMKLPAWINKYSGKQLEFEFSSGGTFPEDLSRYKLIVHCGGCTLSEREMKYRIACAKDAGVPITNYGICIAYIHGILKRSVQPFPAISALLD